MFYPAGDFKPDCRVDFYDFALFASAWLTSSEQPDYNPICDISLPIGKIDINDLALFCDNWLWQEDGETMSMMSSGLGEPLNTEAPSQQPQFEGESESESPPHSELALEPQLPLTEEDIQDLADWLEELWLTDEELRSTNTEADWLEFIESVRQSPVE